MTTKDKKICAVIPAFENHATIGRLVKETRRYIDHIVVVDDGSADNTARLAEDAGARVLRLQKNRGKGNALRIGFRYVRENGFDAVITLDADSQHDPEEIPKFIESFRRNNQQIVVGNRLHAKDRIPRIRYGPNKVGTYLFSWLIGRDIKDSQCGFRLYDRNVLETIHILNDGFEAEADILLRAGKRGYDIGFVPIEPIYFSANQHKSTYRPIKDTFRISIIFLMNLFWKER